MKSTKTLLVTMLLVGQGSEAPSATRYVNVNNASPAAPFTEWATAARTIQEAVDAAAPGEVILVADGLYQTGGRVAFGALTNRVAVDKAVTVQSVNGPEAAVIQGRQMPGPTPHGDAAIRCVYLTNGAALVGFTLTNGATRAAGDLNREQSGGGVLCESASATVSNCVLVWNSANRSGGGAYNGTLDDCVVSSNRAGFGGGVHLGTLTGCAVIGNMATNSDGGGTYSSRLIECLVGWNSAARYGGGSYGGSLSQCTLATNAASENGGGAYQGAMSLCIVSGNRATNFGGGVFGVFVTNSTLMGNWAGTFGGGASGGWLNGCDLSGNSANRGAGAYNATLIGCLLSTNFARIEGGGTYSGTLTNCTLLGNLSASDGGGAYQGTLDCCTLSGNRGPIQGGGAYDSILRNCVLSGNSAGSGGGAFLGALTNCTLCDNAASGIGGGVRNATLNNCILYYNTAGTAGTTNYNGGTLSYCCTVPVPVGSGNIGGEPRFVNRAAGDFRLRYGSPCIDAGFDLGRAVTNDLTGNPRPLDGTGDRLADFDIGAHEYNPQTADDDGDGLVTVNEWVAGTNPTNALSCLRLLPPQRQGSDLRVEWESVAGRRYTLERSTNLGAPASFAWVATNLTGLAGTTGYTHTNAAGAAGIFYRVNVRE